MNCPNCQKKIGTNFLGGENKSLDEYSLSRLNSFLPHYLRKESFCYDCSAYVNRLQDGNHIFSKLNDYHLEIKKSINEQTKNIETLNSEMIKEKLACGFEIESIMIYSNTPSEFKSIQLVESFMVVNSGMWSTSSDNFDPLWGVLHDTAAMKGSNTDSNLINAFNNLKSILKKQTYLLGANSIVDFKYNFSELAGNGKILVFVMGTAAINPACEKPSFGSIPEKFKSKLEELNTEVRELENKLAEKSVEKFEKLLQDLQYE